MLPPEANFFRRRLNVSDMPLLGVVMICSIPPGAGFPHPLGYTCPKDPKHPLHSLFAVAVLSLVLASQQPRVSLCTQFQWTRSPWTLL